MEAGTQFVGFSEDVNLDERKSAVINAQVVPMTTTEMLTSVNIGGWNPITIVTDGSVESELRYTYSTIEYLNDVLYSTEYVNGSNKVSFVNIPDLNIDGFGVVLATSISFNNYVNAGTISIYNNNLSLSVLNKLYFPNLVSSINYLAIEDDLIITELHFPLLESSRIDIRCTNLELFYAPLFTSGSIQFLYADFEELNFPSVSSLEGLFISECDYLININESNLGFKYFKGSNLQFQYCNSIESISLNNLNYIYQYNDFTTYIKAVNCASLTSFSISNLIESESEILSIEFNACPLLTDITLGTIGILKKLGINQLAIYITCPISEQSMEDMLALFVSLDGTNGTTLRNSGYVQFGAPTPIPNPTSLGYISTLISRGWTIIYND